MSDTLTHVAVADILAKVLFSAKKPLLVFLIAFISHGLLDVTDNDYTVNFTSQKTIQQDVDYLLLQTSGLVLLLHDIICEEDENRKANRIGALLGSLFPDVVDGIYALAHPNSWHKGELLFPFHRRSINTPKQSKQTTMNKAVVVTLISLIENF
ncbi:MAG: hypothetical protein PHD88_03810 [Firmicutes bacterium]|nr:hypothetical protein [Bacillota bacterium]MDD4693517.1 hypothetical protein [Bacillota bacterium]